MIAFGVAAVAVGVALGFAGAAIARQRRAVALAPLTLEGIHGRLLFFSDSGCRKCPRARRFLQSTGIAFTEIAFDRDPVAFSETGVAGVPLVVARDSSGSEAGRLAGAVTKRSLARLLARAGLLE